MLEFILFLAGVALGGAISWLITHSYYKKASDAQEKLLAKFADDLDEQNTLTYFRHLLTTSDWRKHYINGRERWIAEANNVYQIEIGERTGDFHEPWTDVYPNPDSGRYPVYLKINDTTIMELTFVAPDEGRIFVPIPESDIAESDRSFYWIEDSIEVQVCSIVGKYYVYRNLEGVARRSRVEFRTH